MKRGSFLSVSKLTYKPRSVPLAGRWSSI